MSYFGWENEALPLGNGKIDIHQNLVLAKSLGQMVDSQDFFCHITAPLWNYRSGSSGPASAAPGIPCSAHHKENPYPDGCKCRQS